MNFLPPKIPHVLIFHKPEFPGQKSGLHLKQVDLYGYIYFFDLKGILILFI